MSSVSIPLYSFGWRLSTNVCTGHKDDSIYDPSGIIERSQADGGKGVIYVSINYRLGLFGWLNGYNDLNIVANGGLYDQRRALDW